MSKLVSGYVDHKPIRLDPSMSHPSFGSENAAIPT